jgi:hypothetical protein
MDNKFKGNTLMDTLYNNHRIQQLLQAYGQWVHDDMAIGWHGYLLSFMFSQIQDLNTQKMEIMRKHLGWFYGRLAKASVPKASHPKWSEFLPRVVLAPDLPVPKHYKI